MHFIAFKEQMSNTANMVYTHMREKHVFCYLDFCSFLKANDPNTFHFLLKVLLFLRFIAKSTYQLLNPALKKPTPREI